MLQKAHGAIIVPLSCWAPRATGMLTQAPKPLWCARGLSVMETSAPEYTQSRKLSESVYTGRAQHTQLWPQWEQGHFTGRGRAW